MISLEEINKSILELESHDTTYATCERLAWLYIVRDHINNTPLLDFSKRSGSEFIEAACNCNADKLLSVLDEHFDTLRILYPREYDAIMLRLK